MKPEARPLVVLALAVSIFVLASGTANAATSFWVSPTGSDQAAGTKAAPFRTLVRARTAARNAQARSATDVTVNLMAGTHRLVKSLSLNSKDSGRGRSVVTYRAAPGAKPVVSGGLRVQGWQLFNAASNIYRAKVPAGTDSRQLFVNGRRALRARGASFPQGFSRTEAGFQAADTAMAAWGNPASIELVTYSQWKMMRCPVSTISGRQISLQQPCWNNVNVFPYLWSFQTVVWVENALELLDSPGEWYLDKPGGYLYYSPRVGENLAKSDVELPVLQRLIDAHGTTTKPIQNITFRGLTFAYGTWLTPNSSNGYAADQSGFHLVGPGHEPNVIGHDQNVARTPGNVRFQFARNIRFVDNTFRHLGGVGLDFDTGSQRNTIVGNRFEDISAAGVQLGGVDVVDHHPSSSAQTTKDNRISNNLITRVGLEYQDAPGVFVGFTTRTTVDHNEISYVPWAGIAIGWGWGLLDPGSFPGLPGAVPGQWGNWTTPTTSRGNRLLNNRIKRFLNVLWDGGAIYTQGQQGTTAADGELIAGNVASDKRRLAGGNTFYTDGGSRYVTLQRNVSFGNTPGITDFGPCGLEDSLALCWVLLPYGTDRGGCRPFGDLTYRENYWQYPSPFWEACPYEGHPLNVVDDDNTVITGANAISKKLLDSAGLQGRYKRTVGAG